MAEDLVFSVSDFVELVNQTFAFAFPSVLIVGELANFRVSKNKWVYFDLKDERASVRFFGTVFLLPGPLEDGMMLAVRGVPRLHEQFGFSVTVQSMRPVGEGSIKKAANLLKAKLQAEGLFDVERKRHLPYPPNTIGLITSKESAAYADFIKILNQRWGGVEVRLINVQVQGEPAAAQIVGAILQFNQSSVQPDVLAVIRGGGSADDLQAFSTEQVTRAVAASRIPTMVAIGHEIDISLAELAADQRASTPSNAAELLVPDRREVLNQLMQSQQQIGRIIHDKISKARSEVEVLESEINRIVAHEIRSAKEWQVSRLKLLRALGPDTALRRGFAIVRDAKGAVIKNGASVTLGDTIAVQLTDAIIGANVTGVS